MPPVNVPVSSERVGVPEIAFASVKVTVTVTLSFCLYGPVRAEDPASEYATTTVGAVLSIVKPVWPDADRVLTAVSAAPTVAVTVPFPAGIVKVPV